MSNIERCELCFGMGILPNRMWGPGAEDHPKCSCGRFSVYESGDCEVAHGPIYCPKCCLDETEK